MSAKSKASLWVGSCHRTFSCILNVTSLAQQSYNRSIIFGLVVHLQSFLLKTLSLKILSPPLIQCWILLIEYKVLQSFRLIHLNQHSWHFSFICSWFDEVFNCQFNLPSFLVVFSYRIIRAFQINPVVFLGYLNCFVPLATSLMQFTK